MLSFIKIANTHSYDGFAWKNAIKFFLNEMYKESPTLMLNPVLQFFPFKVFLRLNTKTWVYHLNFEPGENILFVPQPANMSDPEVYVSSNERLDVEESLRTFVDKAFLKMLVLLLPPKKLILWKANDGRLYFQVDDVNSNDLEWKESL